VRLKGENVKRRFSPTGRFDTLRAPPVGSRVQSVWVAERTRSEHMLCYRAAMQTVVREVERSKSRNKQLLVRCSCGVERVVEESALKAGRRQRCAACQTTRAHDATRTHGEGNRVTPEYETWRQLRGRCLNPRNVGYRNYGGRGITVCARWASYENFLADMGRRPPGTSIDRIDNNAGYSPENCRWASLTVQAGNRRNNHTLTALGRTQTISEWSRETGVHFETIRHRILRGWTAEDALRPVP